MPGQRAGGIGQYFDGPLADAGRKLVRETLASTCGHCGSITEFESRRRMTDHVDVCRGCMRLVCLRCAGGPCDPMEAKAEREELAARIRERAAIGAWRCY